MRSILLSLVALIVCFSHDAEAASISWTRIQLDTVACCATGVDQNFLDTGELTLSALDPLSITSLVIGTGTATATASFDSGAFRTFASASSVSAQPGQGGSSQAIVSFLDTLAFSSPTIPDGTAVQLLVSLGLSYSLAGTCNGNPTSQQDSRAEVQAFFSNGTDLLRLVDNTCDFGEVNNQIGLFTFILGQDVTLFGGLETRATGAAGLSGVADAGNTFLPWIQLSGDITFSSASGNRYQTTTAPTPVPEPATLTLLGSSLLAIGARRLRRR